MQLRVPWNSPEAASLAAILVGALILVGLERRFPYNPGQRLFRAGFWTDLVGYGLLQSWLLGVLIGRLLGSVPASARAGLSIVGGWPLIGQLALFVVTHDLYIYLFHRWQHSSPFLWRFHEAHHSPEQVDWLSGVRSHPFEILVNQTVEFLPLVLLGASPEVFPLKGAVSAVWGMFIHSNVDVRLGAVQRFLNGPEMHRWHHATGPASRGLNFATKLAAWDWWFGTAFLPDPSLRKAEGYGLGVPGFPPGYLGQVLHALRPRPG